MIQGLPKKLSLYILTLFVIVSLNFCLIHLMPGDALVHLLGEEGYAYLSGKGDGAPEALKTEFGMDGSLVKQYLRHLQKTITGDWGYSYHFGRPVAGIVFERLLWTLLLLFPAVLLGTVLGGWIGALSGWRSRTRFEKFLPFAFLCIYAVPGYCISLLLLAAAAHIKGFPVAGVFPAAGSYWSILHQMALPLFVLTLHGTAYKYMIMRNAVRQELDAPYVLTALARGLTARRVLFIHILKNTLPAYISVVALNLGFMAGGALLVEVVFSWQGMGTLIYQAVLSRDYPLLSGALMMLSLTVLAANLAADFFYSVSDPRIREGGHAG